MILVNEPLVSDEAKKYVNDALDTGWISSAGKYVDLFEKNFAQYLGVKYATTTTNGTTALHLAMEALGIGKDDEVIIPDLTIISCAYAALYVGAKPVLVDVDPLTGNLDPQKIEHAITPKTKAILPVHLTGCPADMPQIMDIARRHELLVVEDAAQAILAKIDGKHVGSWGETACFSLHPLKNLNVWGDGGLSYGPAQFQYRTFKWMRVMAGKPHLKWKNAQHQIYLLKWAIQNGHERHWRNCYRKARANG